MECKICRIAVLVLFFTFIYNFSFAQTSASQIERTQEIVEKEEALRNKIEKEEKVFIKNIIVQGATLLSEEEIKKITSPFQKHWLSKDDIQGIVNSLKAAYQQKGYNNQLARITYQVKKSLLKIRIEEN